MTGVHDHHGATSHETASFADTSTSPALRLRREDDRELSTLVWQFDPPVRVISSAPFGGGLHRATWIVNAQVPSDYARVDPAVHVREIADDLGLVGDGTGMLTAVDVRTVQRGTDASVHVAATVGLGQPTWASSDEQGDVELVGTINVVAWVPVALSEGALVNAVVTVTEAKTQALIDAGVHGTGTATDAVVVACPDRAPVEAFAGPRSTWGARLARATHAAVAQGAHR